MDEIETERLGMVVAELIGGPLDGQRFHVPDPAPYEWRRAVPPVPLFGAPEPDVTTAAPAYLVEHYRRDVERHPDGAWRYRWQGVS